jgi:CRISPR-associated protein Cas1
MGIMHTPKKCSPAYALDLMEPLRSIVDRAILGFVQCKTFAGKDFTIQRNGICRLNPELARRLVQVVGHALR